MKVSWDFSLFHPLDHWPGTRDCRSLPGGTWNHLKLTWEYRRRDQIVTPFRAILCCPLGRHRFLLWYCQGIRGARCAYCTAERPLTEQEWDMKWPFE